MKFFSHFIFLNWNIADLQHCVSAAQQCESAICIHIVLPPWSLPPTPTPPSHPYRSSQSTERAPSAIQKIPTSVPFYTWWCIRDTKGIFHAKMGSIKDRNGRDLTEAEDIKKWQEYTEELCRKDLHNLDNHNGVITHLESDILECEVKWALGSITTNKASEGDGSPVGLV